MLKKFFSRVLNPLSFDVGIDLGTANTRVGIKGIGLIKIEPSVVAINKVTGEVLAVGEKAKEMLGKTPANIVAVRPLQDGVVVDFETTLAMLKHFINVAKQYQGAGNILAKPRVLVGVPFTATDVEKEATIDAALLAGAREAYIIEEPIAAAIGIGLPIESPQGNMVVDIGGGTTDITVISLGGLVVDKTITVAGDEMDEAIIEYIKQNFGLLIGPQTAEEIKKTLGNILPSEKSQKKMRIHGTDLNTRLPHSIEVTETHIAEALAPVIVKITDAIKEALEEAPPEINADIHRVGIVITGGGSQIRNLDKFWQNELKIPVRLAKNPQLSVLHGILKAFDNLEYIKRLQESPLI